MKKGAFAWPKGQRIALAVTVMPEQWSEGKAPLLGVQGTSPKPRISLGTYGGKAHARRLMAGAASS